MIGIQSRSYKENDETANLIEGNEAAFNNWAHFAFHWQAAGIKLIGDGSIRDVVRRNYVHDNNSRAIWLDLGVTGAVLENNLFQHNGAGVVVEVSHKNTVRNNASVLNGLHSRAGGILGSQIIAHSSDATEIYGNTVKVAGTYGQGISIWWQFRENNPQLVARDNWVHHNMISSPTGTKMMSISGFAKKATEFYASYNNRIDFNIYQATAPAIPQLVRQGKGYTLEEYRQFGYEINGKVK